MTYLVEIVVVVQSLVQYSVTRIQNWIVGSVTLVR